MSVAGSRNSVAGPDLAAPGSAARSILPCAVIGISSIDDVRGRDHVLGQRRGDPGPDPVDVDDRRVVGRGEVADQALAQAGQVADDDDGLPDAGIDRDRGGDLTEFDAEAADLDLFVGAADELDVAVGVAPGQIAGAVHPAAGGERVGDEALGGQRRPAVVAVRDMRSADVDLADRRRPARAAAHRRAGGSWC